MRFFLLYFDMTIDIEGVDHRAYLEPVVLDLGERGFCWERTDYDFFYGAARPLSRGLHAPSIYTAYDAALTLAGK